MCWCDPTCRTPCCGRAACHDAARRAGKLGGNDAACVWCFPPGQPPRGTQAPVLTEAEVRTLRAELVRLRDDVSEQRSRADAAEAAFVWLQATVNTPEVEDFAKAVVLEAQHQRLRWGTEHDAGKEPADWYWLIAHLSGKALERHVASTRPAVDRRVLDELSAFGSRIAHGDDTHRAWLRIELDRLVRAVEATALVSAAEAREKALHHAITTAAALANWHAAILGKTNMRPGIAPPEETTP